MVDMPAPHIQLAPQEPRQQRINQELVGVPVPRNIVEAVQLATEDAADEFGFGRERVTPAPKLNPPPRNRKKKKRKKKKNGPPGGERGGGGGGVGGGGGRGFKPKPQTCYKFWERLVVTLPSIVSFFVILIFLYYILSVFFCALFFIFCFLIFSCFKVFLSFYFSFFILRRRC